MDLLHIKKPKRSMENRLYVKGNYGINIKGEGVVWKDTLALAKGYCRERWGVTKWRREYRATGMRGMAEAHYIPDGTPDVGRPHELTWDTAGTHENLLTPVYQAQK